LAADETASEASLHQVLERRISRSGGIRLFYVQRDPASDDVTLSLSYPPQRGNLRPEDLLDVAYNVVGWAFHEDGALHGCAIRILYRARERAAPDVALTAETTRNTFEAVRTPDTAAARSQAFERLAWNPFLFPAPPPFKPAIPPHPLSTPSTPAFPSTPTTNAEGHATP
jgi:hypothetical protein